MSNKQLISDSLLATSGAYGITMTDGIYSSVSFVLCLVSGILGIIGNMVDDATLKDIRNLLDVLCTTLCVPLFAMEATTSGGQNEAVATLNLLTPVIFLFSKYALDKTFNRCILWASFGLSLICIAYFSYKKQQIFGYFLTVVAAISEGGHETKYGGGIVAIANFLAVQFFNEAKSVENNLE